MLRRISTNFKRSKSDRDTKQNGTQINGDKRQSKGSPPRKSSGDEGRSQKVEDGVSIFDKYAQVLHASRSPLANHTGDSTTFDEHQGSRMQDLRALGFQDLQTAKNLIMSKAKGEPVDDKTMLMEKIIQVRLVNLHGGLLKCLHSLTPILSCYSS
jgi:linoleate 10R-lipoxygenase